MKNISISYSASGAASLAPAYDIVATAHFEKFTREMGMAIGTERNLDAISAKNILAFAKEAGVAHALVKRTVKKFEENAIAGIRKEGGRLAACGFEEAPYIADELEEEASTRLGVMTAAL